MIAFYGTVTLVDRTWEIRAEPHVAIKLKRMFASISRSEVGALTLSANEVNSRDLAWFMERFPMTIKTSHRIVLDELAKRHVDRVTLLNDMIDTTYAPRQFELARPARDYQARAAEMILNTAPNRGIVVADEWGLGKTITAIAAMTDPRALPACVVTLTALPDQWKEKIREFAPGLDVHVVYKQEPYTMPKFKRGSRGPDVVVINYHKMPHWASVLRKYCKLFVFDEVHELRGYKTLRYNGAIEMVGDAVYRVGLTATLIYNYGGEAHTIYEVLAPGALGTRAEFTTEWCTGEPDPILPPEQHKPGQLRIADPDAFGMYLRSENLMIRRTYEDVGMELAEPQRVPVDVDVDDATLAAVADQAEGLARIIVSRSLSMTNQQRFAASRQFDMLMRQTTGIAKAKFVAEFAKMILETGKKVVIGAWHREVYAILGENLKDFRPSMFTGSESNDEKKRGVERFKSGESSVLMMSIRSGAGLDGLQGSANIVLFAELDWSPGAMDQFIARLRRFGQPHVVIAYFAISAKGSDPIMAERLGVKRAQAEGIRNPGAGVPAMIGDGVDHVYRLAEEFLKKRTSTTVPVA